MRQISLRIMGMIHPTIDWRQDEHAHGSWILWSVSRVRSKTMHSPSCITPWLPYITLCYIDSRFFLPLEQSCTALLAFSLAITQNRSCWNFIAGTKHQPAESMIVFCILLLRRKDYDGLGKLRTFYACRDSGEIVLFCKDCHGKFYLIKWHFWKEFIFSV